MRRNGKVIGTRKMGFWLKVSGDNYEYYLGPVSAYVDYHKFSKGKKHLNRKTVKQNLNKDILSS
jgi:hypothetical protein